MEWANFFYESDFSSFLRTSPFWYPFVLSSHVVFVAATAGGAFVRFFLKAADEARPVAFFWSLSYGLALIAGFLLFICNPFAYVENPVFLAKIPLVLIAGILSSIVFKHEPARSKLPVRLGVILLWVAALSLGRLIAFF